MSEKTIGDALMDLESSLIKVDAARHALGSMLEDLDDLACSNVAACILYTLDVAAREGRANFEIVHKAMAATKE